MKKVLFTATVDSHILQFHLPFLKMFKDQGYEVHVATNGDDKIPYCDVKHKVCFERSPFSFNNIKAIMQLKQIVNKEQFDIIHCHTPMGGVVTRLACKNARKKYRSKVIYTAHGFHFYKGAPIFNWLFFYPVEKYLAKYTDTIITINDEDYKLAKKKFKTNIEYVPGVGVDPEKFDVELTLKDKNELRKSLGLKSSDYIIIFPAELNKNKNQLLLINTMKLLVNKNKKIHLLLPGKDSYNGYYQKLVDDMNLSNNIHFLGYRKDIPSLLRISDLAVSSSLREGLPVNIIESMYVGLPIIALDNRGTRNLISNGKNGYLISSNSPISLYNKIIRILRSKDLTKKFVTYNSTNVNQYLLNNILTKMKKIYDSNLKIKIIHLLATSSYSGAENVVCQIINMFKDNNNIEMYYCSYKGSIEKTLKDKKIKFIGRNNSSISDFRKIVKEYNPDIIHAHDIKTSVLASLFSKKCTIISHVHGNCNNMKKLSLKSLLYLFTSNKFKHIFWVSKSCFVEYKFYSHVKDKSTVLANVISIDEIVDKSKENNYKSSDVIFVGRLTEIKNPTRLIKVFNNVVKKNNKAKLLIVGNGNLYDELVNLVNVLHLNDNVIFEGFQTNPFKYMINSKMMIMTSIHEGTPMCALEAMSLGLPIISTPTDGLVDIIKQDKNGFLSDSDKLLSDKIIELLNNDKKLSNMSKFAIESAKEINDLEKYKNQIYKYYR